MKRETSMKLNGLATAIYRAMERLSEQKSVLEYLRENFDTRPDNEPTDHNGAVACILEQVSRGVGDSVEILDNLALAMSRLSKAENEAASSVLGMPEAV